MEKKKHIYTNLSNLSKSKTKSKTNIPKISREDLLTVKKNLKISNDFVKSCDEILEDKKIKNIVKRFNQVKRLKIKELKYIKKYEPMLKYKLMTKKEEEEYNALTEALIQNH